MTKRHEKSSEIIKVEDSYVFTFFSDCVDTIRDLRDLNDQVIKFLDGEIEDDELYDELDELVLNTHVIHEIGMCFISVVDARNKYLKRTCDILNRLESNIGRLVNSGRYPEMHEAEILQSEIFSVIGGLSYFLLYDFCINEVLEASINREEPPAYDEVYMSYLKAKGLDPVKFGTMIAEAQANFRLRLDLFDEYPELEEDFEKIMGPDYNLIPEGLLKLEDVKAIIDGSLSPSELIHKLNCEDDEPEA